MLIKPLKDGQIRPKVSVIVPVYKVEKYLNRCLETIVNQTLKEIELILIDDGSPDQCGQMCDGWAKRDNRVKVVHQKNQGLGFARNCGLDIATGEYVSFVDSDDFISLDAYQKLYTVMKSTSADICYFGYFLVGENKRPRKKLPGFQKIYTQDEIKTELLIKNFGGSYWREDNKYNVGPVWNVFYQLDYIKRNNIRFWSEREWLSEDIFFNMYACYYAKKAVVIEDVLYYYCQNYGSLTRSYRVDRLEKSQSMYAKMLEIASQMKLGEETEMRAATTYLINVLVCLKQEIAFFYQHGLVQMYKNVKTICDDATLRKVFRVYPIEKLPLKQTILFICMKYNRILMVILLVILRR